MIDLNHVRGIVDELDKQVFSLYLHTDNARQENQSENPAWRIEAKNALSQAAEATTTTEQRDKLKQIREQVEGFLSGFIPTGKSLVMFVDVNQIHTHELPLPIDSQYHYGEPLLTPLLWTLDEYERYLIVQVDSEQARFTSAYMGGADAEGDMEMELESYDFREKTVMPATNNPSNDARQPGGNNRDQYDAMVDAHRRRFYNDVAEHVRKLLAEMGNPRLIVSGDDKAAHAFVDLLPDDIKRNLAGAAPASFNKNDSELLDAVMETALVHERERENELVDEVINFAKAGGRGALGHADVVQALIEQRVETLVLTYPPVDVELANDLKLRAFRAGTEIELVHGLPAAKLESEGGVGARLYYAYEADATNE